MSRLMRGGIALVLALGAAAPASATPTWLPPEDATTTAGVVTHPSIATDAVGSVFAVWASDQAVLSAARPADPGGWEPPQTLSGPGGTDPQIAVTRAGTAIAVWLVSGLVQAAVRPPGGAWGPAQTLSSPLDTSQAPQVAVDAAGDAFAVWGRARGGEMSIQASLRPVTTGVWGPPEDVTIPPASDYQPKLAVSARGDALVVWTLPGGDLMSSFRSADTQAWAPPQTIAAGGGITSNGYASPGLDSVGNAVVVFEHREGLNAGVVASRRPISTGQWEPWTPIGGGSNQSTDIAVDGLGTAIGVWQGGGSQSIIQAAVLPPGGSWSPAETLSQGITHRRPRIAVDGAGDAIAVWQRTTEPPPPPPAPPPRSGLEYAAQAAVRPVGGSWQVAQDISLPGIAAQDIGVAADAAGDGVAVWRRSGDFVQVAAYDGAGPVVGELTIPANGQTGVAVTFSAAAFDVWSDVAGAPTWTFGDGATAVGDEVMHAYAAPGSYAVSVRFEDTLANATTTTGAILIAPPPPPLPPPPPAVQRCVVPNVIGRRLAVARARIRRARCRVGTIRRARSRRVGRVIGQRPRAGARRPLNTKVNLVLGRR